MGFDPFFLPTWHRKLKELQPSTACQQHSQADDFSQAVRALCCHVFLLACWKEKTVPISQLCLPWSPFRSPEGLTFTEPLPGGHCGGRSVETAFNFRVKRKPQTLMIDCKSFFFLQNFCLRKVIPDGLRLIQMEANPNIADKYHLIGFYK